MHLDRLLVVVLALAACSSHKPAPPEGGSGVGGSGGTGPVTNDCDQDFDGYLAPSCGGNDCDDHDPRVHPGAREVCDGIRDDDCNGSVDDGCACTAGQARLCYPPGQEDPTRGVGACSDGWQLCSGDGLTWGTCTGAVTPVPESSASCDGVDQDCNGVRDDGVSNACGTCGPAPFERCGNGLDDDCDGRIDPPELCNLTCDGVDGVQPDPPAMLCCFRDPDSAAASGSPVAYSFTCLESPGMPACDSDERLCLDLDGDASTSCVKDCFKDGGVQKCLCGSPGDSGDHPSRSEGCGFETPCAHLGCEGRTDQPCYTGNPETLGKGICHAGKASCVVNDAGAHVWGDCQGEQVPQPEVCGDGVDSDCDGIIDEEDGATHRPCQLRGCPPDAVEICNDGQDNDCDGVVDEGCPAKHDQQVCYPGPPETRGVGACKDGVQKRDGSFWGPCLGAVVPTAEICGDGVDSDCNGLGGPDGEDTGCCVPSGEETCNGKDDDCDGLADEGLLSACGTCDDSPCFQREFLEPANCLDGTDRNCVRITASDNDPDAFTLSTDKGGTGVGESAVYFALDWINHLSKYDTVTGDKLWEVDTHGESPSRTGVALDGTVWVGNRGFKDPADTRYSNTVHIDRDGNIICLAETPGMPRGLAIDAHNDVWVGTYVSQRLLKVSGAGLDPPGPDGIPRCTLIDLTPDDPATMGPPLGVTAYGAELASDGFTFWANSLGPDVVRWDTEMMTRDVLTTSLSSTFDIAVDPHGDAWIGGDQEVVRLNGSGPYLNRPAWETHTGAPGRGITVDEQGVVWAATLKVLERIDPLTLEHKEYAIPGAGLCAFSAAPDAAQKIWLASWNQSAYRFDPVTETFDTYDLGSHTYARSDLTGARLRVRFARQGSWTQVVDSGFQTTEWRTLDWTQFRPDDSRIEAYVRFATTRSALDSTNLVCGPYLAPPVDLRTCASATPTRFAAINFLLRPARSGQRPTVGTPRLSWTRP